MKIEKISDTQIRVMLNHSELKNRDIQIGELAYGSTKAQALFRDMMLQAYEDFGFEAENVPLMIEAVPLSADSIMIIVTKIEDPSQIDEKLDAIGERPTHRTFKHPLEDRLVDLDLMEASAEPSNSSSSDTSLCFMYCFSSLDTVSAAGNHIAHLYFGETKLYKYQDHYYMIFYPNQASSTQQAILLSMLDEFGQRGATSMLNEAFLLEHGQPIIKTNALEIVTQYI